MNALIICGSGNKDGFTAEMCKAVAEGMRSKGVGSTVIYPLDMDIHHCTGCDSCSKTGECVISDDMSKIYSMFEKADLLILSTPIRFSGTSSVIKMVIDRFQKYWFKEGAHPKYVAALLCGGSPEPKFGNVISVFKTLAFTTDMKWIGDLTIPDTDSLKSGSLSGLSYDFGKDLVSSVSEDTRL